MEFAGFLGNAELKRRLSASFEAGRTSHCYLLCGPGGSGKRTLAKLLAQALQCTERETPCGRCAQCRKVLTDSHPDVIRVDDPEKKTVYVDLIRRLQADAYIRPNEGRHKVYVIPRAQNMNESAQNALLKLIEEPPSYAVFLLLTDNADKLLPTVRSRCAVLRLEPVPRAAAMTWLAAQCPGKSQDALAAAYVRSGGYLGQARDMLAGELTQPQTAQFAEAFAAHDGFSMIQLLCAMEKLPRDRLLEILLQWKQLLTDALTVRAGLPGGELAMAMGQGRTARDLAAAAETVQKAMDACNANIGTGHICGWLAAELR